RPFSSFYIFFSYLFFFSSRRRHTRSKRDWSSDVCSSDLKTRLQTYKKEVYKNGILLSCAIIYPPLSYFLSIHVQLVHKLKIHHSAIDQLYHLQSVVR